MLAKKTTKNQITLPKKVIARFTGVEYFDVSTDGACIILRPLQKSRADEVRARLTQLGIEDEDVTAAISWARKHAAHWQSPHCFRNEVTLPGLPVAAIGMLSPH